MWHVAAADQLGTLGDNKWLKWQGAEIYIDDVYLARKAH